MILYAPFAARTPSMNFEPSPKDYPFAKELAELLEKEYELIQVGGNGDEQVAKDFRKNLPFTEVSKLIKESVTGICVDSYLQHHYWYQDRKAIVLWGISDPNIFGHPEQVNLIKDRKYLRDNQFDLYYRNQYNPEAFVSPEVVLTALKSFAQC